MNKYLDRTNRGLSLCKYSPRQGYWIQYRRFYYIHSISLILSDAITVCQRTSIRRYERRADPAPRHVTYQTTDNTLTRHDINLVVSARRYEPDIIDKISCNIFPHNFRYLHIKWCVTRHMLKRTHLLRLRVVKSLLKQLTCIQSRKSDLNNRRLWKYQYNNAEFESSFLVSPCYLSEVINRTTLVLSHDL